MSIFGSPGYDELTVPVPGGDLAVLRWPARTPGAPVVVAVHGITANALAWGEIADRLAGRATLVAPDLRGRAGSRDVDGPFGLARHADDVAAITLHAVDFTDALQTRALGRTVSAAIDDVSAEFCGRIDDGLAQHLIIRIAEIDMLQR